jgi:transcriptional regulator with XRE-family HTH domain
MGKQLKAPAIPDTPGKWMAWFRYRHLGADGERYSCERLSQLIGVSESTLRRWETGAGIPHPDDLARFAQACGLSALEVEFLERAFHAREEDPPNQADFYHEVGRALSIDCPAYVMDSLFFLRAWNSYAYALHQPPVIDKPQYNLLEWTLRPEEVKLWDESLEPAEKKGWRRVESFWLASAGLCGTDAYRALVQHLCKVSPIFKDRWLSLDARPSDVGRPLGVAYRFDFGEIGVYQVIPMELVLPPVYHVRVLQPYDKLAEATLAKLRAEGPAHVSFDSSSHWSFDM